MMSVGVGDDVGGWGQNISILLYSNIVPARNLQGGFPARNLQGGFPARNLQGKNKFKITCFFTCFIRKIKLPYYRKEFSLR
jgi:hypothetical protein